MIDVRKLFEKFSNANFFSRVDDNHLLELHVGLDEKGRKAIALRSQFNPRKVTGTAAIEVSQYKKPEYCTIRFSLCDEEISGLFYKFCEDLIEQTRSLKEKSEGYTAIVNRFFQWKKMFVSSKSAFLTESQIMGLIGEILYLGRVLLPKLGSYYALKSWSGQELTHKDFSYGDTWAEVKTIRSGGQTVKIASLEQLESEHEGILAVYSLEKMSTAYNGITLNKLVIDTRALFTSGEEKDRFAAAVALQGYEYNNYYDEFVYEISGFKRYSVKEGFPRLTSAEVDSAIKKVAYEISLTDITPFEMKD